MLSFEEGERAVKLAREAIVTFLGDHVRITPRLGGAFEDKRGVFVTLKKNGLRGCIGHPYPDTPLSDAIVDSAITAAIGDPRFPPAQIDELDDITIEVTILTPPKLIEGRANERPEKIQIGKHGLLVKLTPFSGLLLPQVATEYGLGAKEFLSQTCIKAGLTPDMWLDERTEVYIFGGQIFAEVEPNGEIIEKKLS
ncbi:MAG: TIGR00296 family protein [Methanocellales archaeon]|nr:TIGR00296 family protein [Methanocellales archaeon]